MNIVYSSHKKLDVWQRALVLAEHIYQMTAHFPIQERYGLSAQMRRASVSVLSNISEGAARRTRADYIHFLHIARGSIAELDAQLTLAKRLCFAPSNSGAANELTRVAQLLNAQISSLQRTNEKKAQSPEA